MMRTRLLLPWEKKYCIVCPKCGGRIETRAIWFWEKQNSKSIQLQFCHALSSEFLEKIPVLSENDWKSWQRWSIMGMDLRDSRGASHEELYDAFFKIENGLPKILNKYGIFALIYFFNMTELKVLFLFLSLPSKCPLQVFFMQVMGISRSYVSTILKELRIWRLIEAYKAGETRKGRARGRQLIYNLADEARRILDEDLRNYDFFRSAVIETVSPVAQEFSNYRWRKDLVNGTKEI